MPTPFSSDDLGRICDGKTLTRGRSLVLFGAVDVRLDGETLIGTVEDKGVRRNVRILPVLTGKRVGFQSNCSCRMSGCVHIAATGFAGLDQFPALRKLAPQNSFLDRLEAPAPERQRVLFSLSPGKPPESCFVSVCLTGLRTGALAAISPRGIIEDSDSSETAVALAHLLGAGETSRVGVPAHNVAPLIRLLLRLGDARWSGTGKKLIAGAERSFDASSPPPLPPKSAILLGDTGPWYVDAASGEVGRVRLRQPKAPPPAPIVPRLRQGRSRAANLITTDSERAIVERPVTPILRMQRLQCPDDFGRLQMLDAMILQFDYAGMVTEGDDERQFVRVSGAAGASFVRRNVEAENSALDTLVQDGFIQMRVSDGTSARGRRVFVFRGPDAGERWHRFLAERVPALESLGFRAEIDRDFGPRVVQSVGVWDVKVADVNTADLEPGKFSLDFGIEIDGERLKLLPILSHLLARGGMEAAQIVGDDLITTLEDGRVVKLPAERIRRMLAVMGDLIENAERVADEPLVLPQTEVPTILELEDLLAARWQDAALVEAYAERFRGDPKIPHVNVPAEFRGHLRPYQQQGVNWLQHLMASRLGGFLADDMGLGKTAQTIAHIVVEHVAGRLRHPALIVVPTSLITNWVSELEKFAPGLRTEVLHGLDRHRRRDNLDGVHVVVTTYTVLTRDISEMSELRWHVVVLDEAQAVKSPDAKATRAVCQLEARQRLCLSGTPIENNLEELWSQFAFLMPGLLGDRRGFARRFRTPIEKNGDDLRRIQLVRRIKPFIMRRTKSEVATELPPKHTILRRITLAPDQRELYETIRVTMYEKVREEVAERSLARSRIVVLDALLKLRQACCDPRLVKLQSARQIESSSKLDDLIEMMAEMIPEGRRILLFSQFTSMLDLIKPRLAEAGIPFVELRGDTVDRATPVRRFEAGEVPLFLISLKAGGRGLNLVSADTVIHYDPWWNPAVEDQASDRAHRIGQTKSVFVYKMIAADTVEERILELQQRKADLASIAFSEEGKHEEGGDLGTLDAGDIDFLFGNPLARKAA